MFKNYACGELLSFRSNHLTQFGHYRGARGGYCSVMVIQFQTGLVGDTETEGKPPP
jgi:hypothetical protein